MLESRIVPMWYCVYQDCIDEINAAARNVVFQIATSQSTEDVLYVEPVSPTASILRHNGNIVYQVGHDPTVRLGEQAYVGEEPEIDSLLGHLDFRSLSYPKPDGRSVESAVKLILNEAPALAREFNTILASGDTLAYRSFAWKLLLDAPPVLAPLEAVASNIASLVALRKTDDQTLIEAVAGFQQPIVYSKACLLVSLIQYAQTGIGVVKQVLGLYARLTYKTRLTGGK